MGDYESRMEDARIEAGIERCLRDGTMGHCYYCNVETFDKVYDEQADRDVWMCKSCQKEEN